MTKIRSIYAVADKATEIYRTDDPDAAPDLVDLGLDTLRRKVGGVWAGNLVVIGGATNVGKSSLALAMMMSSKHRSLYLSREDDADLVGVRLLAARSLVDPVRIRNNDMAPEERRAVRQAREELRAEEEEGRSPFLIALPSDVYNLDMVEERLEEAAAAGCRWGVFDYVQRWAGESENIRAEIGNVLNRAQTACRRLGMVPVMLSQVGRASKFKPPELKDLKESGAIENNSKLVILAHLNPSSPSQMIAHVAKSSFGGGGTKIALRYDEAGTLREEGEVKPIEAIEEFEGD